MELNNALDQMDLTDIYRTFHPKEAKYTFFKRGVGRGIMGERKGRVNSRNIYKGHMDKDNGRRIHCGIWWHR